MFNWLYVRKDYKDITFCYVDAAWRLLYNWGCKKNKHLFYGNWKNKDNLRLVVPFNITVKLTGSSSSQERLFSVIAALASNAL